MSHKSRHHGRYLPRSKRRKFRQGFDAPPQPSAAAPQPPAAAAQPPVMAQRYEPAPAPRAEAVVPVTKAPAPRPTATLAQPPSIGAELRMIGILSGIILAIIIALALVLS